METESLHIAQMLLKREETTQCFQWKSICHTRLFVLRLQMGNVSAVSQDVCALWFIGLDLPVHISVSRNLHFWDTSLCGINVVECRILNEHCLCKEVPVLQKGVLWTSCCSAGRCERTACKDCHFPQKRGCSWQLQWQRLDDYFASAASLHYRVYLGEKWQPVHLIRPQNEFSSRKNLNVFESQRESFQLSITSQVKTTSKCFHS